MKLAISAPIREVTADDAELVTRFKGGDVDVFTEITRRHWAKLFSIAYSMLHNHEDAEEVTQDTLIRASKGLLNFRGDSALSTWLYRIVVNLSRNRYWHRHRRRWHRHCSLDSPVSRNPNDNSPTLADVLASDERNAAELNEHYEIEGAIAHAMRMLNQKHREILVLRNERDCSYEEISQMLGIGLGTVKSRIARARETLRAHTNSRLSGEL
ncbi:MAG: sigma-70 family RNA polymerase sigma factor [Candidatus Taylorbacteria bacterium]|nr:sigma-70 family RNA polymerase sigma factor [Candidatus Taylorbacteria bacterium]